MELRCDFEELEVQRVVHLDAIVESSTDAIVSKDLSGNILVWNNQAERLFGYSAREVIGQSVLFFVPSELREREKLQLLEIFRGKRVDFYESLRIHKNGRVVEVAVSVYPLKSGLGKVYGAAMILKRLVKGQCPAPAFSQCREIETALEEKEILLREIHHRVKNNLQVVSSLLRLQANKSRDEEGRRLFLDSQNRVATMALLHEQLYQSRLRSDVSLADYFGTLVQNLFLSYGVDPEQVKSVVEAGEIYLDPERIIPCGLIVNELVSNSLKYAFLEQSSTGVIRVSLTRLNDAFYELMVSDNGNGLPETISIKRSNSLGLKLVRGLARQLGGSLITESGQGTCFRIRFPRTHARDT